MELQGDKTSLPASRGEDDKPPSDWGLRMATSRSALRTREGYRVRQGHHGRLLGGRDAEPSLDLWKE